MTNTISLYGSLARKFEKKYNFSAKNIEIIAKTAKDVINALEANFPGFKKLIRRSGYYRITNGQSLTNGLSLGDEEVEMKFRKKQWHIMPVACGCSAAFRVVIGVVLIAVGIYTQQYWLASIGFGLAMGGVSEMLAPSPTSNADDNERPDERPSYLFDGPKNTVEPGLTIPVVYGECFAGSITVSGGLRVIDQSYDIDEQTETVDAAPPADTSTKYDSDNSDKYGDQDASDDGKYN